MTVLDALSAYRAGSVEPLRLYRMPELRKRWARETNAPEPTVPAARGMNLTARSAAQSFSQTREELAGGGALSARTLRVESSAGEGRASGTFRAFLNASVRAEESGAQRLLLETRAGEDFADFGKSSAGKLRQAVGGGERQFLQAAQVMREENGHAQTDHSAIFAELERRLRVELGAG